MHAVPRVTRGPGLVKALIGVNVLIVDADTEGRDLLDAVLAYCGALVTVAPSASEAVAMYRRSRIDVVVAGVARADDEVCGLARELRALSADAGTVAVVALAGRDVADGMLRERFDAYVRKPADPWDLCRVIAALAHKA